MRLHNPRVVDSGVCPQHLAPMLSPVLDVLALSRVIVSNARGNSDIASEFGHETVATVHFPSEN